MKKLLIIKTGTTFPWIRRQYGDFEDLIIKQIGLPASEAVIVPVYEGKTLPELKDISAIIITGSHAMVTEQDDWSLYLARWLRHLPGSLPVLGICYGHQVLAAAWGGVVDYHPGGREVGTVKIALTAAGRRDPLLGCLSGEFCGYVTHAQTVLKLPERAQLLAYNAFEPHHAFVINGNMWGVQFHPEFTAAVMHAYIDAQRDALCQAGCDVEKLHVATREHDYGRRLLRQFIKLAG